jgi:transposase InsO family protein
LVSALIDIGIVSTTGGCDLVGLARSTFYRITRRYHHYQPLSHPTPQHQRHQPAALTATETTAIIALLEHDKYADLSVVQTYWRAFDAGDTACSQRTFYRVASRNGLVGDRRRGRHSTAGNHTRSTPTALATKANQLWSWDITELPGPTTTDRYKLYLAIDVFSRYPITWRIEHTENRLAAIDMFTTAITTHGPPNVLHSDNGATMRSRDLIATLTQHNVLTSYSRPRVSDDNPFSESLFKTIKYDLNCPERFDNITHARTWTHQFLHRYATEHRHSGLKYYTPEQTYTGTAAAIQKQRHQHLTRYYNQHPNRFRQPPTPPPLPTTTGINPHLSQTG